MNRPFLLSLLFPSTLLLAGDFGTIYMSATLFALLLTLIFALTTYLKNLQKENQKNRALFDYSDVPTLLINSRGVIVELNQSAQTLLGYSKKQLASQKWYEKLLPDESAVQIRHKIHQTLKEDTRITFHSYLIPAKGKVLEIDYTLSVLPAPLKGSILTLVDAPICSQRTKRSTWPKRADGTVL
ncbi:MAG: PAS domain-containing protein [Campylobacterota bacterium]